MGEASDKSKGAINEAVGKAKRAAGVIADRPDIEAEGAAQESTGKVERAKGAVKKAVKDIIDKN
ncbi:CsbD family protein [Sphingomonas oleivorans]|uniref:CsbD family protein n=1 Tax=Sphingomonas oleivorans TaxID=1735121 RepID=A0A2T5G0C1_9SPHN|nr:CsbD family protein [Sphingomonas oleivorans]PTQ12411.1 CsbD family protein [Sphingomonas oleivorans]